MAQLKKLLEPGYIGNVRFKNRVSMAPAERCYANMDGSMTQKYIDYLVERAKNGVGMINLESTYIDPVGRGRVFQLGIHEDRLIPGHRRMTDALHKYGAKVVAELHHAGRQTSAVVSGFQPVGPSDLISYAAGGDLPRVLTTAETRELILKFAEAARRSKVAGYDMVLIHGAHGYIVNAYASPFTNKREDEYGGTAENRIRFPLELYEATRAAVGNDYPVGYRISADEFIDGGLTLDDTKVIVKRLEEAGLDFIDVSAGIYESGLMICASMDVPIGYLTYLSAAIKETVKMPVIATGRINDMVFAESVLENGQADFVHMVRAFHADPEILVKSKKGQMDDVCMCVGCNKCTEGLGAHIPIICTVNPAAGRERELELKPAKVKKKVMVIGGGVAGMEAARITRIRGHDVTIFEKDEELGGQIRWASKPTHHQEFSQTARYLIHEVNRTGVKVVTDKEVTVNDVESFKPDAVVVATGAVPFILSIPGIDKPIVSNSFDVLSGKRQIGKKNLVIGGQREGLTVAEYISENGGEVIVVEFSNSLATDSGARQEIIKERINEDPNISYKIKTTVEKIEEDGVVLQSEGKFEKLTGIDLVVLAWARASVNRLADEIESQCNIPEVYRIGDAVLPRDASDAIYEGAVTGRRI